MGTYAFTFWPYFTDKAKAFSNVVSMLGSNNWFKQNYAGEYFVYAIAKYAITDAQQKSLIDAVANAVRNDAKKVIENQDKLPRAWLVSAYRKAGKKLTK